MLATTIIMAAVALIAGYAGAQWQKKRQSSITKREATELRRDIAEIKMAHNEHWEVHRVIKYQIEGLAQDILLIGQHVGLDEVCSATEKRDFH
jgi:hypothetical protein